MNKGRINREIFIFALLSGRTGVEAVIIAGSRATNNNSRAVIACRLLRIVKKSGLLQRIQDKLSLILNSIDMHDLKNAKLYDKARAAKVIGEVANKLLNNKLFT